MPYANNHDYFFKKRIVFFIIRNNKPIMLGFFLCCVLCFSIAPDAIRLRLLTVLIVLIPLSCLEFQPSSP